MTAVSDRPHRRPGECTSGDVRRGRCTPGEVCYISCCSLRPERTMPSCQRKGPSASCASGVGLRQVSRVGRVSCGKHGLGQRLAALPFGCSVWLWANPGSLCPQRSRATPWRVHGRSLSSRHSSLCLVKSAALAGRDSRALPQCRCLSGSVEGAEWSSPHFQPHCLLPPKQHPLCRFPLWMSAEGFV